MPDGTSGHRADRTSCGVASEEDAGYSCFFPTRPARSDIEVPWLAWVNFLVVGRRPKRSAQETCLETRAKDDKKRYGNTFGRGHRVCRCARSWRAPYNFVIASLCSLTLESQRCETVVDAGHG